MKYIHLFVIALFLLSSCSEDSINTSSSTNNGKPFLEVLPSSINAAAYESFNLKYRVANFPFEDQVNLAVDFGNGDSLPKTHVPSSFFPYHYKEPGNYTMTFSAYDAFADTLLATKKVPVTINSQPLVASISPMALDTIYNKDIGSEYYWIYYSASTNINVTDQLTYTWAISGNGYNHTEVGTRTLYLLFPSKGTYQVKMTLQDYGVNNDLATDSTTVTIR